MCVVDRGGWAGGQEEAMAGGSGWGALRLSLYASALVRRLYVPRQLYKRQALVRVANISDIVSTLMEPTI